MTLSKIYVLAWIGGLVLPVHLSAMQRLEALPATFADIRDPLLPPGYAVVRNEPDPEQLERDALAARIAWPSLQLRGITHAGRQKFVAVIEGIGIVEAGDEVRLRQADLIYTWRIDKINAAGLTSTRLHVTQAETPGKEATATPPPPTRPPGLPPMP